MNWKIIIISFMALALCLLLIFFIKPNKLITPKAEVNTAESDKQQLNKNNLAEIKDKIQFIVQESIEEEIQKEVQKGIEQSNNDNGSSDEP